MDSKKSDNMYNDPTDQFFRQKLSAPEAAAPMGDWPSLQERVRGHFEKRKKRRLILLFFIPFLVAAGFYFIQMTGDSPAEEGHSTDKQKIHIPEGRITQKNASTGENSNTTPSNTIEISGPAAPYSNQPARSRIEINADSRLVGLNRGSRKRSSFTPANKHRINASEEKDNSVFTQHKADDEHSPVSSELLEPSVQPDTATTHPQAQKVKKKQTTVPVPAEVEETSETFGWVDVHAGVNYTNPHLSGIISQPGYLDKRRREESGALRAAYGVSFHYMANRIIGSLGVDVVAYGETVDYSNQAVKRFQTVSGGQFVYQDSMIENASFVTKKENRFRYMEFPLYLGYKFPTSGKLGVSVMGGVTVGFLVNSTITYIDTALTGAYVFENQKYETFRQQVFSAGILPSLEYRMRSASEFYVSFPLRYHLTSVMHKESGVKQRYFSPGLQFGFRVFMSGQ